VVSGLVGGLLLLIAFGIIETRVADPMFSVSLLKIRPFWAGNWRGTFMNSLLAVS
jgi:hypothetical protein